MNNDNENTNQQYHDNAPKTEYIVKKFEKRWFLDDSGAETYDDEIKWVRQKLDSIAQDKPSEIELHHFKDDKEAKKYLRGFSEINDIDDYTLIGWSMHMLFLMQKTN